MGRFSALVMAGALGLAGAAGCGGEDGPTALLEWVSEPPVHVERGQPITASWTIDASDEITTSGLLACSGAVPDCGLSGMGSVAHTAGATETDGVYTASLVITDQGNFTVTAYAFAGGDFIAVPIGVVVDKLSYPVGPYGNGLNSVIQDFSLQGYKDSDDEGDDPFDDLARQIKLSEFFQGEDLDAKLIVVNVGAGWCPYCAEEMQFLARNYDAFHARGIRFLSVVIQDDYENTADLAFAVTWGNRFDSKMATAIDPTNVLGPYYPDEYLPMTMMIEAREMKIVYQKSGWLQSDLTQAFDYYAP